jgi:ubiquinone/menaquinone biosynthesis C-methylase UbiE
MDKYTEDVKVWLDRRFAHTDSSGVYVAHQPMYGFRKGPTEPDIIGRYIITFQIMRALANLDFNSFLDVGGADGYKAALVRSLFGAEVISSDLSQEACKRAKEIFNIDGGSVDIHQLPYDDNQFDVVLCSETLEHVPDFKLATLELFRVCSKAVVITVPHESERVIQRNIENKLPHSHIHSFNSNSFDFVSPIVTKIIQKKIRSSLLKIPCSVLDGIKREKVAGYPGFLIKLNNRIAPYIKKIFGQKTASFMISFDNILSKFFPICSGFVFVLFKDDSCYTNSEIKKVNPNKIIEFKVPFHCISTNKSTT